MRCGHRLNGMELILKRDFIGRSQSRRTVLKATLSTEQEVDALSFELLIRMEILRSDSTGQPLQTIDQPQPINTDSHNLIFFVCFELFLLWPAVLSVYNYLI